MKRFMPLILVTLWSPTLLAWGPVGHQIVAQIAEDELSPTIRNKVLQLLDGESMAAVSNWADKIKSDPAWAKSKPWHFVNIPDGEDYGSVEPKPQGDAVTAITQMTETVKSKTSTRGEKQEALKFLIHLVGDLHQPLHAGRPTDMGGNSIKVVFNGKNMNLHSLWDSGMISTQNMDYLAYAHYLEAQSFLNPDYDLSEIEFSKIIKEDMSYRKDIYDFGRSPANPVKLDKAYLNRNLSTVNARLLNGGKRLAALLTEII